MDGPVKIKDVWRQETNWYKGCACKVRKKKKKEEGKAEIKKQNAKEIGVPLRPFYGANSFLERNARKQRKS